jgi:hypothetical protein
LVNPAAGGRFGSLALALRQLWARHGAALLWLAILVMAAAAAGRLVKGFYRLLFDPSRTGAVDLLNIRGYVDHWLAGAPLYGASSAGAKFPPGAFPVLWALLGWPDMSVLRWAWAAVNVAALAWLAFLAVRETGARGRLERGLIALWPLAITGCSVAVGNGQLVFPLLALLLPGLFLIVRRRDWWSDLLGAALMAAALAKPSLTVPFGWIVLFAPGRLRPAAFLTLIYAALTLAGASAQPSGLLALFRGWLATAPMAATSQGYANVHNWLKASGLIEWSYPAALAILAAFGLWTFRQRRADLWTLIGAGALVSRLWTYHFIYDDVLILLPLIAIYRTVREGQAQPAGGFLLAVAGLAALAPARLLNLPWPWGALYEAAQTTVWLAMLAFVLLPARAQRESLPAESPL